MTFSELLKLLSQLWATLGRVIFWIIENHLVVLVPESVVRSSHLGINMALWSFLISLYLLVLDFLLLFSLISVVRLELFNLFLICHIHLVELIPIFLIAAFFLWGSGPSGPFWLSSQVLHEALRLLIVFPFLLLVFFLFSYFFSDLVELSPQLNQLRLVLGLPFLQGF